MTGRGCGGAVLLAVLLSVAPVAAQEAGEADHPAAPARDWSFDGPLGRFDMPAVRRGLDVYLNVCSFCHSLEYVAYRNLTEIGLTADEAGAIAARYQITDGPDDFGAMFQRSAILSDRFVPPFANPNAARAAMGGALPPDLSLIVKAEPGGADYVFSLLTGYGQAVPADVEIAAGMNYNPYYAGGQIAMPPPLYEGAVSNAAGGPASVEEMAHDVTQFLTWAAEPRLEARKRMGLGVMIFLVILTGLFVAVKRRVWADVH